MSHEYRREYLLRLPLPLAQLYSRAHNAKDARSRHDNAFYLCEALVKLAAAPLIAGYLDECEHGAPRVAALDRLLAALALPSLGQWLAMLRELARWFGARPDAAAHPLGQVWGRLNGPRTETDLPGLTALYRRIKNGVDGAPAGDRGCSPLQAFDALVQYRNGVFGHGGPRFPSFYEKEMGPLLFPAVNDLLAEGTLDVLGPRGGRLVHLTELRTLEDGRIEVGLRELTGLQGERLPPLTLSAEQAAALAPGRTAVLWPGRPAPLRLDPLLAYREGELSEEVLFLNRDRNSKQVEYLSYTTGRTERDKAMAPALAALLSRVVGRAVGEDELKTLQEQSVAETPSVEALFDAAAPAAQTVGDYAVLGELGRGGMGVVYLARQTSLGRLVALKMLPADLAGDEVALARFRREVRALARCDHPHIVKVLARGALPDGRLYYAMEYVPGCDLEQVWRELSGPAAKGGASDLGGATLARAVLSASQKARDLAVSRAGRVGDSLRESPAGRGAAGLPALPEPPPLPDDPGGYQRRVAALVRDAALALQAVHDQGLVHRDVKPSNLMLTADGSRLVLMDFGLTKGQSLTSPESKAGGLLGTLRYAAPEQLAAANMKVGPAADVRGLGVTLWELLTRRRLFAEAEDEGALTALVLAGDVPRLRRVDPTLDRDLEAIVARATERSVADRIPTAGRLAEYLQLYLEGKPLPIRPPGLGERTVRWVRRQPALAAFMALFVVSLLAGAGVSTWLARVAVDRADTAEKSDKRTKDALKIVEEEKEKTEDTLAVGLLRPLGHDVADLTEARVADVTAPEIGALWDLARSNARVRRLFIEDALHNPSTSKQLRNRADMAVHAAVGLDSNRRQQVADLVLTLLRNKETDFDTRTDCVFIGLALGPPNSDFVKAALDQTLEALAKAKENDPTHLRDLADAVAALAPWLGPEEASKAARQVVRAMDETGFSIGAEAKLAGTVAALAPRLAQPEAAKQALAAARKALGKIAGSSSLIDLNGDELAGAVAALAPWLGPEEASEAAQEAVGMMAKTNGIYANQIKACLAYAVAALATRLGPKAAPAAARLVRETMTNSPLVTTVWPRAFTLLAPRLDAEEALTAAKQILHEMDDPFIAFGKAERAASLTALAPRLGREGRSEVVKLARETMTNTTSLLVKAEMAHAIAALEPWLGPEEATTQASSAVRNLREAMANLTDESGVISLARPDLAGALAALAPWLGPEEASAAAKQVLETITKTPYTTVDLAPALATLAPQLGPKEASDAARQILQTMANPINSYATADLTRALAALAPRLGPELAGQASAAAPLILEVMAKANYRSDQDNLANALAALIGNVGPQEATRRIRVLVWAVGNADSSTPTVGLVLLAEATHPRTGPCTEKELVDLLKMPTCVLPARQVIVTQLGNQCGRAFANMWDFVDWAREHRPDLDLTSPPERSVNPDPKR